MTNTPKQPKLTPTLCHYLKALRKYLVDNKRSPTVRELMVAADRKYRPTHLAVEKLVKLGYVTKAPFAWNGLNVTEAGVKLLMRLAVSPVEKAVCAAANAAKKATGRNT